MSPLRIHYSRHAVREMQKAGITRQVVRLVLAHGTDVRELTRVGQEHHHSALRIEHRTYRVQWIQAAGYVLIVSVWVVGDHD